MGFILYRVEYGARLFFSAEYGFEVVFELVAV
jgi:hypothetical protein